MSELCNTQLDTSVDSRFIRMEPVNPGVNGVAHALHSVRLTAGSLSVDRAEEISIGLEAE